MHSIQKFFRSHPSLRRGLAPVIRVVRKVFPTRGETLTQALAVLFRNVEMGSLIVSISSLSGSFEMDFRSDILRRILVYGEYEPDVVEIIKKSVNPHLDVIDVGANIGLLTILLSSLVSDVNRVLAIEPTSGALKYLRSNLERNNRAANVIVFAGVATSSRGKFRINVVPGMEEFSSLVSTSYAEKIGKPYEQVSVPGDTIDNLIEQYGMKPGFIKIDTEGAEYQVLLGCEQTLIRYRPVILCEVWPDAMIVAAGGQPGAVMEFLESREYVVTKCGAYEVIAVPAEKKPDHTPHN